MRALFLLLGGLLTAEPQSQKAVNQGVPVVGMKLTGDAWEDLAFVTPKAPCESIRSQVTFVTPPGKRPEAEALLKDISVRPLSDQEAAHLLDRKDADKLFSDLLGEQWTVLDAQRAAALINNHGNWSGADAATSSDLISLTKPHYPAYRPYLVRALNASVPYAYFNIHLCGDVLTVDGISAAGPAGRTPLIVYLQAAPATATPRWFSGP